MQILKNKHLVLAMIVAPVLAIIAYFAVDYTVSEKPQAALPGQSYKLAAKSNCRYQSGACTLQNGDIEVLLRAQRVDENQVELVLSSDRAIQNVVLAYVTDDLSSEPLLMTSDSSEMDSWNVRLNMQDPKQGVIRLALSISGSMYFAETTTVFIDYETSFSRDNFNN